MPAQVPTYGAQKETLRPMGAMQHEYYDASRLMLNVPNQVNRGFSGLSDAADNFAKQLDETRVLDVETRMRQYIVDQTYGSNGYTNLKGEAACLPDKDGQGLAERSLNGFDKELSRLTEEMQLTPRQNALARKQVAAIRGGFYNDVSKYAFTEAKNYTITGLQGAASQNDQSAFSNFMNPQKLAEGVIRGDQLVEKMAAQQGWNPEMTEAKKLETSSSYFANAIDAALMVADRDPRAARIALNILNSNRARINGETAQKARARINVYLDQLRQDELVQGFKTNGSDGYASAVAAGVSGKDGATFARDASTVAFQTVKGNRQIDDDGKPVSDTRGIGNVGLGISGMSVTNAKATAERHKQEWNEFKFRDDKAYNAALALTYMDDCVRAAGGDMPTAYALYFTDDKTVAAAKEAAQKDGAPETWMSKLDPVVQQKIAKANAAYEKAMSGRVVENGKEVSPFQPGYAVKSQSWATRDDAERYVRMTDGRANVNPEWREKVVDAIMRKVGHDKETFNQQKTNLLAQATRELVKNGGNLNALPASLLSQFNPTEINALGKVATHLGQGNKAPDWNMVGYYKMNPDELAALSDDQFYLLGTAYFGKKFDEMALLRGETIAKNNAAKEKQAKGVRDAEEGRLDYSGTIGLHAVESAVQTFKKDFKLDNGHNRAKAALMDEYLADFVQRNPGAKDMLKSTAGVARVLYRAFYLDTPDSFDLEPSDLKNWGRTDSRALVASLAKSRWHLDREPNDFEMADTLFYLMNLKSPNFNLSPDNLPKLDVDVANRACDDLGVPRGTNSPAVYRQYILLREGGAEIGAQRKVTHAMEDFVPDSL
jgi:hypothetical protein|nr:MAG TPA_asm: putative lysin [Caudoviricetes sp.]